MLIVPPSNASFRYNFPALQKRCHINSLPPEVLVEMFHFATSNTPAFAAEPVNLSQVSCKWRSIAFSTSTLWTNIQVEETLGLNLKFHHTCNRVKHFLDLSRRSPLTVEIVIRTFYMATCMEDSEHPFHHHAADFCHATQTLSRVLAGHVARFKTFNLVADDFASIADVQLHFPQVSMPLLESWKVHQAFVEQAFSGELEEPGDAARLLIPLRPRGMMEEHSATMYPNLKVAGFHAIPMAWAYFSPRHLQALSISFLPAGVRPTMAELRQILMANEHSLESFIIQGAAPLDSGEPFEMRGVRFLTLGFVKAEELISLLRTMRVPNLSQLSITDLRRACTSAADRPFISYDTTVLPLFAAIIRYLPLSKLDALFLRCLVFLPFAGQPAFSSPLLAWSHNRLDLPVPALPMFFFSLTTSLRDLTLIDPDPTAMHCLNYLPKFNADPGLLTLPIGSLARLHLVGFNLPLVQSFFMRRIQARASFRPVEEITLSMPSNWWPKLRFDFSLIARKVGIIHVPIDLATEKYLLRRIS